MIRNFIIKVYKPILSLIIAVLIVNGVCMVYYRQAYWFSISANATSSLWNPGSYILQNKEGSGYQMVDGNGYLNDDLPLAGGGMS